MKKNYENYKCIDMYGILHDSFMNMGHKMYISFSYIYNIYTVELACKSTWPLIGLLHVSVRIYVSVRMLLVYI